MAKLTGLRASIVGVADEELPEFVDEAAQDQNATSPTTTRYVQVAEGSDFGIKIRVKKPLRIGNADGLGYTTILDGVYQESSILLKNDELKHLPFEDIDDGMLIEKAGQHLFHKFQFAKLRIETDDNAQTPAWSLEKLGSITVEFWRWKSKKLERKKKRVTKTTHQRAQAPIPDDSASEGNDDSEAAGNNHEANSIHEKALKGKAIHVAARLGKAEAPRTIITTVRGKIMDNKPISTFILKYRTLEALKQMHIIPRSPSPLPLRQRPLEDLTEAEKTELLLQYRNDAAAATARVKQEQQERNLDTLRPFKRLRAEENLDDEIEAIGVRAAKRHRPEPDSEVIEISD